MAHVNFTAEPKLTVVVLRYPFKGALGFGHGRAIKIVRCEHISSSLLS